MTTTTAQRRLLEALAELHKTDGGIAGVLLAFPIAIDLAIAADMPELAQVWQTFSDLADAVRTDQTKEDARV